MSIEITYNAGVYEVNGLLNSQNGESLKNHLKVLMDHSQGVVLSLNKVVDIDIYVANIIMDLSRKAELTDKLFYVIGRENQKVQELFSRVNCNDILL